MYKLLIIFFFPSFFSMLSCKFEKREHSSGNLVASRDTNNLEVEKIVSDTASPKISPFSKILKKIENNSEISSKELILLINQALNTSDEADSEQNGSLIFTYLKGNGGRGEGIAKELLPLGKKNRERFLSDLIGLMCIDIIDEDYDYKGFIRDFRFCEDSFSAKLAFQKCLQNR